MDKKLVTIAVVVVLAVIGAFALSMNSDDGMSDDMMMGQSNQMTSNQKPSDSVQETNMITYEGFAVIEKKITVKKGTTVTWTNQDSAKHDVTPDKETSEFKASELFSKGETYSVTFNTPGTYSYFCSPHPYMKGSIEVTE